MKNLLFLAILACASLSVFSQTKGIGDTTTVELITFESESLFFKQGTPTDNIWQIGKPSKTNFSEAYSAPNAIVTDTLNSYPVNNHSWFDLEIDPQHFGYMYLGIEFYQKMNSDALKDGGYISISYNNPDLFTNIIDDSIGSELWWVSPSNSFFIEDMINLYTHDDTLFNGDPGFSGNIDQWQKVSFCWYDMVIKKQPRFFDTITLRFNFISDDTDTQKEGWMIDDIRIFWVDLGGNIHEKPVVSNLEIYPNPMTDKATIRSKNQQMIDRYEIYDLTGKQASQRTVNQTQFSLLKGNLQHGVYLVKCYFENSETETVRIQVE